MGPNGWTVAVESVKLLIVAVGALTGPLANTSGPSFFGIYAPNSPKLREPQS